MNEQGTSRTDRKFRASEPPRTRNYQQVDYEHASGHLQLFEYANGPFFPVLPPARGPLPKAPVAGYRRWVCSGALNRALASV
jgi:hypothetical protein